MTIKIEQAWAEFRIRLHDSGILLALGDLGLYATGPVFEQVYWAVDSSISHAFAELNAEVWRFPTIEAKDQFERTGYVASFPQLTASLSTFTGGSKEHAELLRQRDETGHWEQLLEPAGLMMCPAACHQLYPVIAGVVPDDGRAFDLRGACFRREPSLDPTRWQSFSQHEYPFVGTAEQALAHRDWAGLKMLTLLRSLGLTLDYVRASDPFFGRAGRMLTKNQLSQALKYEITCPIYGLDHPPVALGSANYHGDHFALEFGLTTADGPAAHSSCVGVGLERVVLALFAQHGLDPQTWPATIRDQLWP